MKCPKCRQMMHEDLVGEVTVDHCSQCKGIWFDKGELDQIKEDLEPDLSWLNIDFWKKEATFKVRLAPLYCPKCLDRTLTTIQDRQTDTEISLCNNCQGIWLDAGQFSRLLMALSEKANSKTVPEYIKESLRQAGEMIVHPGRIVSEWKDLKTMIRLLNYRIFVEHPNLKRWIEDLQKSLPL